MSDVVLTDKLKDFPTKYNNDISSINDELHFKKDGSPSNIKYTGTATISGDLNVTGNITSTFSGNIDATNVVLSGGNNLESELNTITNLNTSILDHARDFERRAENIRKVTPSGFSSSGSNNESGVVAISDFAGLVADTGEGGIPNSIRFGHIGYEMPSVVINGYSIKIKGIEHSSANIVTLPSPPTTGTRQDLVFIEVWKEEVNKETGLFFPYGNTQYASSDTIDGSTLNNVQAGFTGSAYFTSNANVYCVRANVVSQDFLSNPEHNVGVLENGNFFQVRYRIRVEVDAVDFNSSIFWVSGSNTIRPQGQLATAPIAGGSSGSEGLFIKQHGEGGIVAHSNLNDSGIFLGGLYTNNNTSINAIPNLSLDGFTYAIPVCAIHRRNTGVYSLGNQNGTSYISTTATFTEGIVGQHTATNSANYGLGGDTFYDDNGNVYINLGDANGKVSWQLIEVNGSQPTTGNSFWFDSAKTIRWHDQGDEFDIYESWKYLAGSANNFRRGRPDGLFGDIIDRRDVLDLRHKVSLNGKFDEDELYQETFDLVLNGNYRQEWQEQKAYDADGNGLATIDSGIYGNVLLETLGLGATVPDAHINTNITKVEECNNGTPTGFNGARTQFSDDKSTEDYTAVMLDHSSASVLDSDDNIVTYNSVTKTITIDMTQHSSYVNDLTKDPTILAGHLPVVKWGNGAHVAGVWTRSSDYNWSFEVKEYGAIVVDISGFAVIYKGAIYTDSVTGNHWEMLAGGFSAEENGANSQYAWVVPLYTQQEGSANPSGTFTKVSGLGPDSFTASGSQNVSPSLDPAGSATTSHLRSALSRGIPLGYSNSAHGTSSTESIFSTIKLDYKAGSSCLPELPYGDDMVVLGGKVFIDGTEVDMPESFRPMGGYDKHTKTVKLSGFSSRKPVLDIGPNGSSDDTHLYPPCVIKDGSTYKMWYGGHDGSNLRMHYSTSTNGIDWDKQGIVVDLGSNGETDDTTIHDCCVIKDGSTYKMWYGGHDGTFVTIHYATSSDGISWSKQGRVLDRGSNGETDDYHTTYCSVIKDGSTYKMWYSGYDGANYRIHYATSSDGINWSKQGVVVDLGSSGDFDENRTHTSSVIKDGSLYKMIYSGRDTSEVTYVIGYAISRDGINWIKKGVIGTIGVSGAYDDSRVRSMCFIKDGSSYKGWTWNYDGANYRIGYSVLAMSDPNNTGSSTTGVYTNTNPQVNFGFKSNDTIVLHYERMALQTDFTKTIYADTLDIKKIYACNYGTSNGDPLGLMVYNQWYPGVNNDIHTSYENPVQSTANVYDNISSDKFIEFLDKNFLLFDTSEILGRTFFRNVEYPTTAIAAASSGNTLSLHNNLLSNYIETDEYYQETGNVRGGTMGTLGIIKTTNGELLFHINYEHGSQAARKIAYLIGVMSTPLTMIGRPLIK